MCLVRWMRQHRLACGLTGWLASRTEAIGLLVRPVQGMQRGRERVAFRSRGRSERCEGKVKRNESLKLERPDALALSCRDRQRSIYYVRQNAPNAPSHGHQSGAAARWLELQESFERKLWRPWS